jgi:hypothetical protein
MQSVRQLLASQSRLLAAVVARRKRVQEPFFSESAISASVSRGSLEMAAPWRKKCTFMRLRAHAAKRKKSSAGLQLERRRLQPTRWQTDADASRTTAEIQL